MKINRQYCDELSVQELVQSFMQRYSHRMKLPFILSDLEYLHSHTQIVNNN